VGSVEVKEKGSAWREVKERERFRKVQAVTLFK
jgi:hypothetical protein